MSKVKLISVTQPTNDLSPEGLIAYCARVSSSNQDNPNYEKLLRYCLRYGHWSVFEMVDMTVEIVTTRAISAQIIRHRSFCFQEHSQRYAKALNYEPTPARRQDTKNRQNSIDDISEADRRWFLRAQQQVWDFAQTKYEYALKLGIAKECARSVLPLNTQTRLYMKGSVRSWIHYLQVRCDPATQKEHRDIALAIRQIFNEQFPTIAAALEPSRDTN